jgi:2-amino-4-hydroxy-6-hydroxymethyldihydropteridine diphosphokinase
MSRVAGLLDAWARARGCAEADRQRWVAAGWLHDSVKDEEPETLRPWVSGELRGMPGPLLHGPAAAARMEDDGVSDRELLHAVTYHTLGHPELGSLGRSLYAADFLEPGRRPRRGWRRGLRARMPEEEEGVLREIVRARVVHLLDRDRPVYRETVEFWNTFVRGDGWARASEV